MKGPSCTNMNKGIPESARLTVRYTMGFPKGTQHRESWGSKTLDHGQLFVIHSSSAPLGKGFMHVPSKHASIITIHLTSWFKDLISMLVSGSGMKEPGLVGSRTFLKIVPIHQSDDLTC